MKVISDDGTTLWGKPRIPRQADMQAAVSPQAQPAQKQTGAIETRLTGIIVRDFPLKHQRPAKK